MVAVHAPAWKFEWNLNTLVLIIGLGSGLIAWGTTWGKFDAAIERAVVNVDRLEVRLTALEVQSRQLDNHELRISANERQMSSSATAMRAVETTLNGLTGDVRVVKEILQRLEASQTGRRPP